MCPADTGQINSVFLPFPTNEKGLIGIIDRTLASKNLDTVQATSLQNVPSDVAGTALDVRVGWWTGTSTRTPCFDSKANSLGVEMTSRV